MYKFLPYMTNDYSTGLYSEETGDIFHSAYGALTEAKEKFVDNIIFKLNGSLKVLDICYGVGYNTKALINESLNRDVSLNIDCVDTNEVLIKLSPFIKNEISKFDRIFKKNLLYKNIKDYKTAKKICDNNLSQKTCLYKIDENVNLILLDSLMKIYGTDFLTDEYEKILSDHDNSPFFDKTLLKFFNFRPKKDIYLHLKDNLLTFVHNIYYRNISKRYNYLKNNNITNRFNLSFYPQDIRTYIKEATNNYDIILLDGFTPQKDPALWSLDLFKRLYNLTKDDGVLITYNSSAPVRNAMRKAGFYIGNSMDKNWRVIGTIASKKESYIKNELSKSQLGVLDTKSAIVYRDKDLLSDKNSILDNREREVRDSQLLSASQYYKTIGN